MSVKNIDIKTSERTVPEKVILFAAQIPEGMAAILTDTKTGAEYRITSTSERTVPEKVILFAAQIPEGMAAILTDTKTGAEYRITSTSERCSDNAT